MPAVLWVLLSEQDSSGAFPAKPISLTVAYAPGGAVDGIARLLGRHLETELGQRVVIQNRAGAGGQIGYTSLATAASDGYQLGFITAPSIQMLKLLRPGVTFAMADFEAIANVQADPVLLVVHSDSPYRSVAQLLAAARAEAGALSVSGDGPLSNNELQLAVAEQAVGVAFNFVPFNGSGPSLTALLGKQVAAAVPSASSAANYIAAGRLRPLAVFAPERLGAMPDVPTFEEASASKVPSIGLALRGVVAPAGLAAERKQILSAAFEKAINSPGFRQQAAEANLRLAYMDSAEFADYLGRLSAQLSVYMPLLMAGEAGD